MENATMVTASFAAHYDSSEGYLGAEPSLLEAQKPLLSDDGSFTSFTAEHDGDSASQSHSSSDDTLRSPAVSTSQTASTKRSRNHSRERLQAELVSLRKEAQVLEFQHAVLVQKRQKLAVQHLIGLSWAHRASHELQLRQHTERENKRLEYLLCEQLRAIEALEMQLRSALQVDLLHEAVLGQSAMRANAPSGMLHVQFDLDIERIYASCINKSKAFVVEPSELQGPPLRMASTTIFGCRQVTLSDTLHVNFDYDAVVRTAWRCGGNFYTQEERLLEYYARKDDELAVRFRSEPVQQRKQSTSLLASMVVLKKFVDTDRTVFVWRSMANATEPSVDDWQRTYSDEEGWVAIERVPEGVDGLEPGTAILRRRATMRPLWTDAPPPHTALQPEDFDRLVVESTRADILAQDEAFENVLLDACMSGSEI